MWSGEKSSELAEGCPRNRLQHHHIRPHCELLDAVVAKWGTRWERDGQFASAETVAVAPDGSVDVAESSIYRIQKFKVGP